MYKEKATLFKFHLEEAGGLRGREDAVLVEELHDELAALVEDAPQRRKVLVGRLFGRGRRLRRPRRAASCQICLGGIH